MNIIVLSVNVCAGDWTAERGIIASNNDQDCEKKT